MYCDQPARYISHLYAVRMRAQQPLCECCKSVGNGGLKPPPDFKLMLCVQAVTTKVRPKFRKTRQEKQLSGYKQCYTYKNQSLEVSKYMNLDLIIRATNLILEAKPPHFSKVVYAPVLYRAQPARASNERMGSGDATSIGLT